MFRSGRRRLIISNSRALRAEQAVKTQETDPFATSRSFGALQCSRAKTRTIFSSRDSNSTASVRFVRDPPYALPSRAPVRPRRSLPHSHSTRPCHVHCSRPDPVHTPAPSPLRLGSWGPYPNATNPTLRIPSALFAAERDAECIRSLPVEACMNVINRSASTNRPLS